MDLLDVGQKRSGMVIDSLFSFLMGVAVPGHIDRVGRRA